MNPASPSAVIGAGALSPDRYFYWDGVQWKTTISADGAWTWNGAAPSAGINQGTYPLAPLRG
jgi:hypothetical protein